MLLALCRSSRNTFLKSARSSHISRIPSPSYCYSSFDQNDSPSSLPSKQTHPKQHEDFLNYLTSNNPHINAYMRNLYKYLTSASIVGISSAFLLSTTVPLGFPSAFLILAGFGMEHMGTEYIAKTKPITYSFRDTDGLLKYGTKNTWQRKLAFFSSCLGYGCIVGSLMGMTPLPASALCLSAITCLFSKLGHLGYCSLAPKPLFKPVHLLMSGLLTGVVGLNLVTSFSEILMIANPLHAEHLQISTYIGLVLYNVFTGHDSQKAIEDVHSGKGDHLMHGNKFSENWLYALIPQFLLNLY